MGIETWNFVGAFRAAARLGVALILILGFMNSPAPAAESNERPLMRFPDVQDDMVVFVHGEDIWSVPAAGGVASRLTIHDGAERFPKISPDGSLIAFTGEYDGNGDVYVMNTHGGEITRLTYHPGYDQVVGWHPLNGKIIFSSGRLSPNRYNRLFLVSADGSGLETLILHEASTGSLSPDGSKIAYTKNSREDRTWKRYRGGTAQEIYHYDFTANEEKNLTNFEGTDRIPMWIGDTIYFSSDRDGVLNIHAYNTASGSIEQITSHGEYDVRRPSMGGSSIIYELGGELWLLDTVSGETKKIAVEILADAPETRPFHKDVSEELRGFAPSPSGKRVLVEARGEIFSVPAEHGKTINLTSDCGARDRGAVWSPDGKRVAYLSDASGEYEIYLIDPMGGADRVKLTSHKDGYRQSLRWSPDSTKIGFSDQLLRCLYLDVETKKITVVDKADYENIDVSLDHKPIFDFCWSPDSRYIAYSKMNADLLYQVYVHDLESGRNHPVSNGLFNDFGPVFSKDGKHLLFVSNRRFDPVFCDFEWEMVYKKAAGIYCLTLESGGEPLLPLRNDMEEVEGDDSEDTGGDEEEKGDGNGETPKVVIDFEGIEKRIEHLPLPPGNYRDLAVNESTVFYLNADEGDFNRFEFRTIGPRTLHAFSIEDREEETVIDGVRRYALSADGSQIAYMKNGSVGMVGSSSRSSSGTALDLSGLTMYIDPMREWKQIYNEAWRLERDFFYDPQMRGLDWTAMGEKYGRLLPYASCRQDVGYLIGELIAELSTSHTYVFGGDVQRDSDGVNVGMLGVNWDVDAGNNRYRFEKILTVTDWTREIIPPLAAPGVSVNPGEYLIAIDGIEVTADKNIYSYFQGLAGEQVTLLVNAAPTADGAREYTVRPSRREGTFRYLDWVEHNRQRVDEASNGLIGYLHLPDTYTGSTREFPKYFYSQTRKKGIIVDGRFNAGGLDPDIFLHRLDKNLLTYWTRRYSHHQTTPAVVTRAHLACLTNRRAGSGGDMLPMEFQMKGMGPVIGTRTWGGLVGLSMFFGLVDGGGVSVPDYRIYDTQGNWIVENEGVQPDIVVDLHPEEVARGYDAQLEKGIEVLMEKIEADPLPWPETEPIPARR